MQQIQPPQLDDDTKQRLLGAQELLNNCRQWIGLCEQAGLDCTEFKNQCDQLSKLNQGLIRTFVNPRKRG